MGTLTNTNTLYSEADMALRFRNEINNNGGTILAVNGSLTVSGRDKNADGSYKALDLLTNQNGGTIQTLLGQGASTDTHVDMNFNVTKLENLRRATETVTENFNDFPDAANSTNDGSWSFCSEPGTNCSNSRDQAEEAGVINVQFRVKSDKVAVEFADDREAQILSGGNIDFTGDEVINNYSLISAAKDIIFDVNTISNLETGSGERLQFGLTYIGYYHPLADAFGYQGESTGDQNDLSLYDPAAAPWVSSAMRITA